MKRKYLTAIIIILMFPLTSCLKSLLCVRGDGQMETEIRRVTSFDQVKNSTSFDVVYRKADTLGISVTAEQNILNYIETNVYDNNLEITTSPASVCLDYTKKPVLIITSPSLSKIVNSGSGSFIADSLKGGDIIVKLSGSGDISIQNITSTNTNITITGSGDSEIKQAVCSVSDFLITGSGDIAISGICDDSHFKITGSGNLRAVDFLSAKASIIISGSGNAYAFVENYLNGLISGSGNIYIKGDPEIDQTVTGSGRIIITK